MKKRPERRDDGAQGDLFRWAASRLTAELIGFLQRREPLPRWIIARRPDLEAMVLTFDRRAGLVQLAPILPIHPLRRA